MDRSVNRIVAAANIITLKPPPDDPTNTPREVVIVGVRHFDLLMQSVMDAYGDQVIDEGMGKEGFVDKFGKWHDRKAALAIALTAGQITGKKCWPEDELFSEDLY